MFDLKVKEFREDLIQTINQSELPITMVAYILKELLSDTQQLLVQSIQEQEKAKNEKLTS